MKNTVSLGKIVRNAVLFLALACPFAVSCDSYDDTEIRERLEGLIDRVYELEMQLNAEIQVLKDLLNGKLLIESVSKDSKTGITTVTLSDKTELQLLPEKDMKSFVTYITSGGVEYWAYIDADGKKQYFLNSENKAIPVKAEMPKVITRDGENFLLIGGREYPMNGNSVFSDYELAYDEETGAVLAVTFTFGEGMSFTITVDGAAGFLFVHDSAVVKDYYVACGETAKIQIEAIGVVDYVLQIPDGWRIKEGADAESGKYLEITAPASSLVESGIAAAGGELKAVAVLEGGKATVAKLYLTTAPFKEFVLSMGNVTVKAATGVTKYVYGACEEEEYDEAGIYETAESLLNLSDYPKGYGMASGSLQAVPLSEIVGAELIEGRRYAIWAIPVMTASDGKPYLKPGTICKISGTVGSVTFDVTDVAFRGANLDMEILGAASYYFGLVLKEEFSAAQVLDALNNRPDTYTLRTEPLVYKGSLFDFAAVSAREETEYVAWIVVATEGRDYVEADMIVREFATLPIAPGSDVTVVATEKDRTHKDVEITLTATGAEKIYYTYFNTENVPAFASEEEKARYIKDYGTVVVGETVETKASDRISGIKPLTNLTLMAFASDATGKYGTVTRHDCATTEVKFNNLVVNLSLALNTPEEVKINISTTGGEYVDYLYWVGTTTSAAWTNSTLLGGSAEKAQIYMATNPDATRFTLAAEKYPVVNGTVSMKDLQYADDKGKAVRYVFVAMAKDAKGVYSNATVLEFMPHAFNIGTVVPSTADVWTKAIETIQVDFIKESFYDVGETGWSYSYNLTAPLNYTVYVLSGNDTWLTLNDSNAHINVEEKILTILSYANKRSTAERYTDEDGDGRKETPHYFTYEHGSPNSGSCTIWANEAFHDRECRSELCEGNRDVEGTRYGNPGIIHHKVYYNDGQPIVFTGLSAVGNSGKVVDKVYVVLQDLDGNCYEPVEFDVPYDWFDGGGNWGVNPDDVPDNIPED